MSEGQWRRRCSIDLMDILKPINGWKRLNSCGRISEPATDPSQWQALTPTKEATQWLRLPRLLSHIPLPAISPKVVRFLTKFRTLANPRVRQHKVNSAMTDTSPTTVNRTLRRLPNSAYRVREYLTEKEVDRLIEAARKRGRNSARDAAAILLAYRHGLRAAELCALRWSQVDLRNGRLHVNRAGRYRECSSVAWARASGLTTITGIEPLRLHNGSRNASYNVVVPENDPAHWQSR